MKIINNVFFTFHQQSFNTLHLVGLPLSLVEQWVFVGDTYKTSTDDGCPDFVRTGRSLPLRVGGHPVEGIPWSVGEPPFN